MELRVCRVHWETGHPGGMGGQGSSFYFQKMSVVISMITVSER